MVDKIRYGIAKVASNITSLILKILPTGGKSLPGLIFLNIAGKQALNDLTKKQIKKGSILITGTNGKTTTTKLINKLLSEDTDITFSLENNTIYALTTALLQKQSEIGVFEYGIRDIEHGIPEEICNLIEPMGIIYTNISREHTQVLGIKNPYEEYIKAKTLLSEPMKNGVIITNGDDPNTAFIGINKQTDNHSIYYGFDLEEYENIFPENNVKCPKCGKNLHYDTQYLNQRGVYSCSCGFKKPELNIKLTKYTENGKSCDATIKVNTLNYLQQKRINYTLELTLPSVGIHNIYNILAAVTGYSVFTTNSNIPETLQNFFRNYEFEVPPGRFEIINKKNKIIGVGQGDNGDALKVNALQMRNHINSELVFIYTTPDDNEEEIFEDHLQSIKALNPDKLIVFPGRTSLDAAQQYYNQIKGQFNTIFYAILDLNQKINKIRELITSETRDIIISGCGEELEFWDNLKKAIQTL